MLDPEHLLDVVATLPVWRADLDHDPLWIRPVEAFGLEHAAAPLPANLRPSSRTGLANGRFRPRAVSVDRIRTASQPWVRLDALAHYLRAEPGLFDRDGWYSDHVVLYEQAPGTYRILDGTHRVASAILRGDDTLHAQVLDPWDLDT